MLARLKGFLGIVAKDTGVSGTDLTAEQRDKVRKEVAVGLAFLDMNVLGWHRVIDTNRLDMEDGEDCVLGQLYGSYSEGLDLLRIDNGSDYGFFPETDEFAFNNHLWIEAINRRNT